MFGKSLLATAAGLLALCVGSGPAHAGELATLKRSVSAATQPVAGWRGGFARGGHGGYHAWHGGFHRGWHGGFYRPYVYSGFYRPYYYGYYRPWFYPGVYASAYYYGAPAYYYPSPVSYDNYPLSLGLDTAPTVTVLGSSAYAALPALGLGAVAPAPDADDTYPYDGGPSRLVPMPPVQSAPAANPQRAGPPQGRLVSLPEQPSRPATRFAYPAYGDEPRTTTFATDPIPEVKTLTVRQESR